MTQRKINFNPGPAVLPLPALEKAQKNLIDFAGTGIGILETSHRSKEFLAVLEETKGRMAKLMKLPSDRKILFMQGGANLQFSLIPMNLLPAGKSADYLDTGTWAANAVKAANLVGKTNTLISTKGKDGVYRSCPKPTDVKVTAGAAYLHLCSNNTIMGTEYHEFPEAKDVPLIADMSSDMLCRKLDFSQFDMIYGGAQKNLGPAGVTLVIISDRLLERCNPELPTMMNYKKFAEQDSLFNTPPVFSIYMVNLVLEWIESQGGLEGIEKVNRAKADLLYGFMDSHADFYRGTAEKDSRSLMNVTLRLPSEDLENRFFKQSAEAGFIGLKGHRSVGGVRVSMYNALPLEGIEKLVAFMKEFMAKA